MGLDLKLYLGVVDVPEPEGGTTYEVAQILERKYGLFSRFFDANQQKIVENLTESLVGSLENVLAGAPIPQDPFAAATNEIDQQFRTFLDTEQMAQLGVPGVPTKAALMGKSVRFKRKRGPRRPSFIDSGTLQASFKSWVK